jgi:hypothetical protein
MRWRPGTLLGLAVMLTACQPTTAERNTVRRWLLCEECSEGELDAVVALGDRVTGVLAEALKGPPRSYRENVRRQAEAMYDRITGARLSQQQYVGHFVDNYVATYQSRSVVALQRIGTPRAHAVLLAALQSDTIYRDDVLRQLGAASQVSLSRFAGEAQSAPLDSFVLVNPTVLVRDSTTGQPLGNVRVVFRVDSGGGRIVDSVQRTGPEGLASVRWQLGAPDSVNVLHAEAAGGIVRFHAAGHGFTPRIVFVTQPANGTVGHLITPAVRIAILDPWDRRVSTFNGDAEVRVPGTALALIQPVVAGEASIGGLLLTVPGTGFRLRVVMIGTTPATSEPFDVTP